MLKLKNHANYAENYDRLHNSAKDSRCPAHVCLGSKMAIPASSHNLRSPQEVLSQANEFFDSYFSSKKLLKLEHHKKRWATVQQEIAESGTYELTKEELIYGAKLAWRNSARCIGRIQWNKLKVFDARHVRTAKEMFDAICKHMEFATNGGNIRSVITIFPNRKKGQGDYKVWNQQLVNHAGYRNSDGTITGDSINVEFTELCQKLGWKSQRTKWDILPLVISAEGNDPEIFDIPSELVLKVPIIYPKFDWFTQLDIEWYALPAVSGMRFYCGGIEFTAAPFNGWYMGTEIGCRDLGDTHRYNYLEEVAKRMKLDTKNPANLWKDQALVEINIAVLYSFQKLGVTIMDHHTASESFMRHLENENKSRGGCPSDWVWIVPPMSGSTTQVFHQEMAMYFLKPSFEYQEPAWKSHNWKNPENISMFNVNYKGEAKKKNVSFKSLEIALRFLTGLFTTKLKQRIKVTILYATETGKSEMFAKQLKEIFSFAFNPEVYLMDDYDLDDIKKEKIVLIVCSTFGNGDPPENGEKFYRYLHEMKDKQEFAISKHLMKKITSSHVTQSAFGSNSSDDDISIASGDLSMSDDDASSPDTSSVQLAEPSLTNDSPFDNTLFSVFALGSTAYPNYCAFGKNVDELFDTLGGTRLLNVCCGNELGGQEEAFQTWSLEVFQEACTRESIVCDNNTLTLIKSFESKKGPLNFRHVIAPSESNMNNSTINELARIHNRVVSEYTLSARFDLHKPLETCRTIRIVLNRSEGAEILSYKVGDHIAILPKNNTDSCNFIMSRLVNMPHPEEKIQIQVQYETLKDSGEGWAAFERMPVCTLTEMFSTFLDITTPLNQEVLLFLSYFCTNEDDGKILVSLSENKEEYKNWVEWHCPTLVNILKQFPSLKPDAVILACKLPILQPRFYSVSSSSLVNPEEVQLTLGVLRYQTKNGTGPWNLGVCSNYLCNISAGTPVACFVRSAPSFHLPTDSSLPVILIGAGTGIAPFRGFWEERHTMSLDNPEATFGKTRLIFGCRNSISVALSREKFLIKTYVQDLIKQRGSEIAKQIFEEGAHVYVCGDCTMAEDVFQTIKTILRKSKKLDDAGAESYMRFLKTENRYHVDVFGSPHKKPVSIFARKSIDFVRNRPVISKPIIYDPIIEQEITNLLSTADAGPSAEVIASIMEDDDEDMQSTVSVTPPPTRKLSIKKQKTKTETTKEPVQRVASVKNTDKNDFATDQNANLLQHDLVPQKMYFPALLEFFNQKSVQTK